MMSAVSDMEIERRALGRGKWANLFMGVAGISAAMLSNASALMLDGLFSAVNFLAAIFAARVAQRVSRAPDSLRPFGYEIDEAVYVMFRALVLAGIILVAGFGSIDKIIGYASGEVIPPVKLHFVVGYVILMAVTCFGLAYWYHRHWLQTGRRSSLLSTERGGAIIDGTLSMAAGLAFVLIAALKGTSLDFLVPISDSIVVLALAVYMIPQPLLLFRSALGEVVGKQGSDDVMGSLESGFRTALEGTGFELLHFDLVRVGRSRFCAIYLKPEGAVGADEIERVRATVADAADIALGSKGRIRTECLLRGVEPAHAEAAETPS